MSLVNINTQPTRRQLNQFGFVWLGFLLVFAGIAWWRLDAPSAGRWLAIAAVVVPVIGWLWPAFMRTIFVGMSLAAFPVGFVVSHVVMVLVYYLVVTPIGLAMRLSGHDPMRRGFDRDAVSYWVERTQVCDPKRYFRQF